MTANHENAPKSCTYIIMYATRLTTRLTYYEFILYFFIKNFAVIGQWNENFVSEKKSTNICLAYTNICHVWVSNASASLCDYRVNLSPNCLYIYILMLCKIITNIAFSLIPDRPKHSVSPSGSRRSTRHSSRFTRLRRSQRYQHV